MESREIVLRWLSEAQLYGPDEMTLHDWTLHSFGTPPVFGDRALTHAEVLLEIREMASALAAERAAREEAEKALTDSRVEMGDLIDQRDAALARVAELEGALRRLAERRDMDAMGREIAREALGMSPLWYLPPPEGK